MAAFGVSMKPMETMEPMDTMNDEKIGLLTDAMDETEEWLARPAFTQEVNLDYKAGGTYTYKNAKFSEREFQR